MLSDRFKNEVLNVESHNFNELALEIFHFQVKSNPVYRNYTKYLGVNTNDIHTIEQIPFLPISFFKSHEVVSQPETEPKLIFESSSTTGTGVSRHLLFDPEFYWKNAQNIFESEYGSLEGICILALLPSYLERGNSSLVYMVQKFIEASNHPQSGFYLYNQEELSQQLTENQKTNTKTLLLGVSFALLDLAKNHPQNLKDIILMETGGMKGRGEEIIRSEMHTVLKTAFGTSQIHSEYGMTELMSQAYSKGDGLFHCPRQMKIMIRDYADPFSFLGPMRTGGINVIDLANIDSCSFIATSDLGKTHKDGRFEILGRFDHSDVRGCNLLYT